jgi:hypothetical protein
MRSWVGPPMGNGGLHMARVSHDRLWVANDLRL